MQTKYAAGFGARAFPSTPIPHVPAGADPHASLRRRITRLLAYGHRGSATENEARAAEYLLRKLAEAGLDAHKEAFAGSRSMGARLLVHVLVAMAALALLPWLPTVTSIVVAIALASLVAEQMTWGVWLSRCVCRATSYNVVGRAPASSPAACRLVLCAHYDTNKTAWLWAFMRCLTPIWARCPKVLKPPLLVLGLLMLAHGAFAVFAGFVPSPQILWPATWLIGSAYAVLAILLAQWTLGKSVPGAADNASGVAAVMKLAKGWRDERPANDVELVVLFSGCEESGLMGAAAWAKRHRDELAAIPTHVINLDGLGFGPPRFLGAEVPAVGLPLRAPARLIDACSRVATEMGLHDAGPHALPGPTDGLAFLARRVPAITIVGFADGRRLPNYHTLSDTIHNIDFPAAQRGIEFAKALLWTLAREAPR